MEVRPLLTVSSNVSVGFLKIAAVRAFPIEMFAAAGKLLSESSNAIKLPPSSTIAMNLFRL